MQVCKAHLCVSFFLKRALFLQVWRLRPGGCGCWTATQRGYHCCRSGCAQKTRFVCIFFLIWFLVNTSCRALGCCCGGVLRGQRWDIVAAGPSGVHKLSRHTPRSLPLFWSFLVLSISLLCCLFCIVSQATKILFVRSASRWSVGDGRGHRFLRFPAPRLLFNGAQFHSPEVRGFPSLFCIASSLYSSLADFCSGERRLFLSLRRRNHLVSDVDRRETGSFSKKNKDVTAWIVLFFKKIVNLFNWVSSSRGRGMLVKAQATARVDVPTAPRR